MTKMAARIEYRVPEGVTSFLNCNFPKGVTHVYARNRNITSTKGLPEGLQWLSCDDNQLTSLEGLPEGLWVLYCDNNQLTSLGRLPESLQSLWCNNNQLTSLDGLPEGLQRLYCNNNPCHAQFEALGGLEGVKKMLREEEAAFPYTKGALRESQE